MFKKQYNQQFNIGTGLRMVFGHIVEPDNKPTKSPYPPDGKYKVTLLIPKDDKETLKLVYAGTQFEGQVIKTSVLLDPTTGKLRDGDTTERPELAGHYYFTPKSSVRPDLFRWEGDTAVVATPEEFYNGCYVQAVVLPNLYEPGKVTYILKGLLFDREGERIVSAVDTKSMFVPSPVKDPETSKVNVAQFVAPVVKKAAPALVTSVSKKPVDVVPLQTSKPADTNFQTEMDALLGD